MYVSCNVYVLINADSLWQIVYMDNCQNFFHLLPIQTFVLPFKMLSHYIGEIAFATAEDSQNVHCCRKVV